MNKKPIAGLAFGLFAAAITFGNFTRLSGGECIRAIHMVSLITCGVGLGVALMSAMMLIRKRNDVDPK